jgi:hypothetical protein
MTTYCSTTELVALTNSKLDPASELTPIIEAADREIDAYLLPYGLSGSATGAVKQASLKLSMAGLLEYGLHNGDYNISTGGFSSSVDVVRAVESNRKAAYALLNQHVDAQTTLASSKRTFGRRVVGR